VSLTDSENSFQPDNKSTDTLSYRNKEAPSTTTPGYERVRERERERERAIRHTFSTNITMAAYCSNYCTFSGEKMLPISSDTNDENCTTARRKQQTSPSTQHSTPTEDL
jgi:hypothetical protein